MADKEHRLINEHALWAHTMRSHRAIPGSTSQTITVLLALGRTDLLPRPYQHPADAWHRLDARQQSIVRIHRPTFAYQIGLFAACGDEEPAIVGPQAR